MAGGSGGENGKPGDGVHHGGSSRKLLGGACPKEELGAGGKDHQIVSVHPNHSNAIQNLRNRGALEGCDSS